MARAEARDRRKTHRGAAGGEGSAHCLQKLWHDLQRSAEQKAGFNPDQPRDDLGKWTDAGGDKERAEDAPKPGLTSQPAAMRRGGPRMPATPAQQARLPIANARAEEAVARVRQLDPSWRAPESLTSRDNRDDPEGMIRAKEAETREAEARFIALSLARQDTPYPRVDAPTLGELFAPRGERVGYASKFDRNVRILTPTEFEAPSHRGDGRRAADRGGCRV